ncbi:MAG: flagellar protein FlgN [Lachnospiraceae bacterium]
MASLMEDLITVLDQENSEYQILLELSMRKPSIIVEGDLTKLEKLTEEEQTVVSRITALEQKRMTAIKDIANVLNKDVEELTLSHLIQMLDARPVEQRQLAEIHDKLHDTMNHMVHVNEQNRALIANALELVEFDLNYMQALRTAPETANYNRSAINAGDVMGEVLAGRFDAKQ